MCRVADGASAPARTQVTLTREAAASIDWATADVDGVLVATQNDSGSNLIILDATLRPLAREALDR
ncbi:MAG: hypothetical protein U5L04_11430 [Trueperaceae bacterium]|nr:hypothetical protein [Trueperaceae bacterium]